MQGAGKRRASKHLGEGREGQAAACALGLRPPQGEPARRVHGRGGRRWVAEGCGVDGGRCALCVR